jgi:tetratricopeptide (TPR) repeat protein
MKKSASPLHTPFLERAGSDEAGIDSQLALGAFLTLRAVDATARPSADAAAYEYQLSALNQFLQELPESAEQKIHLKIASGLAEVSTGSRDGLWSGLLEYEDFLEGEFRLDEGHDVMATACACADLVDPPAFPKLELRRGRVLRRAGHFDESMAAYQHAGDLASAGGDGHLERLSRIGQSMVFSNTGNLPAAEELLLEVIADADTAGDLDAQARGRHDLAVNYIRRGDALEAVPLAYQAFSIYENEELKYRATADLGIALFQLGHYGAARDAQEIVASGPVSTGMRMSAFLELLDITAALRDRVAFERIRREIAAHEETLPPDWAADFYFKLGRGFRDFGQEKLAKTYLQRTIEFARDRQVHQYAIEAEQALNEILQSDSASVPTPAAAPPAFGAEVNEIAAELHALRGN